MPKAPQTEKKTEAAPTRFEDALAELEKLVARLESGNLPLEESLAAHKRGLELARYCQQTLANAQQQVRILEEESLRDLREVDEDES